LNHWPLLYSALKGAHFTVRSKLLSVFSTLTKKESSMTKGRKLPLVWTVSIVLCRVNQCNREHTPFLINAEMLQNDTLSGAAVRIAGDFYRDIFKAN
jgi:type 1 glutamine amidotransferase